MSLLWGGGAQVNKFEKVASDSHQMSLAGGHVWCPGAGLGVPTSDVQGVGPGGSITDVQRDHYSEVQCIMANGQMGTPPPPHSHGQNDKND